LDTKNWLNWNGDLDNPNDSKDNCVADVEADLDQDTAIEELECPEQQDLSAALYVPRMIRPTWKSNRHAERVMMMVNAMETRRSNGIKKSRTECVNVSPASLCSLKKSFS